MAKSSTNVIMAALAGFAAGVVLGILIAPDKGSKTRKHVREGISGLAESAGTGFSGKIEAIREAIFPGDKKAQGGNNDEQ